MAIGADEFERLHSVADQVVAHREAKGLRGINPNLDRYMRAPVDAHRIIPPAEVIARVVERAAKGITGAKLPWSKTHERIRFAPGQLTVLAGAAATFKSSLASQVVIGLAEQNFRACVTSLEEPIEEYGLRLVRQMCASDVPTEDNVRCALDSLEGRLWFWDVQGEMNAARAIAMMRYCAAELRIEHFIFDNLTCVINPSNDNAAEQWQFVRQCHRLARDTGMHVHLVMHTRKGVNDTRDRPPTMDEIRGSGTIVQQADQVIMVWRNVKKEDRIAENGGSVVVEGQDLSGEADVTLIVEKAKFTGWRGRVRLWRYPNAWQFLQSGTEAPMPSSLLTET